GLVGAVLALASPVWAYGINDVFQNPVPPFSSLTTVFPNWLMAPVGSFTIDECDSAVCTWCTSSAGITGVTILNYGSATGGPGGDITKAYFLIACGSKTNSGVMTMTYAGTWNIPVVGLTPAWTWGGSIAWGGDPCNGPGFGCSCGVGLYVYMEIAA